MSKLNCKQAREIPITSYLERLGIKPAYIRGENYWYLSPIREEKHPSFKVNTRINAWYDHGIGEGGNLIDLGLRLHPCTIEELLQKLSSDLADLSDLSFQQQSKPYLSQTGPEGKAKADDKRIVVKKVAELNSLSLLDYLETRGISLAVAKKYCKEVTFSFSHVGRSILAVGFKNLSGGYELRNEWFKGLSSPKDLTFLDYGTKAICVFEGFIDFLSMLELTGLEQPPANILVLNSVSLVARSYDLLKNHYHVFLFLNRDKAGKEAAERIRLAGVEFVQGAKFNRGFNDINDYLLARKAHPKLRKRVIWRG